MRCLVTGATGFLGRHLVRALTGAGHEVRALVRYDAPQLERDGAALARGDVLQPDTLGPAMAGVDVVFHLAGKVAHRGDASALFATHVDGTRHVVRAAREAGVGRLVHASSSGTIAVTRTGQAIPDERAPYATEEVRRWPYYLAKIYSEKVALEAHARGGLPVVVLNPSLMLGPEDESMGSSTVLLRFLGREIPAVPPGGINFVDVRDVAAAAVSVAERGQPGERYLLGGPNMTLEAFFVLLSRVSGVPAPTVRAPARANDAAARVLDALEDLGGLESDEGAAYAMAGRFWYLDARKAQAELGFAPRPPEATLRDAVAWLRSRGPLPRAGGLLGAAVHGLHRVLGR